MEVAATLWEHVSTCACLLLLNQLPHMAAKPSPLGATPAPHFLRYCGVSMNCSTRANSAAALLTWPGCLSGESSSTTTSSTLKMAAARAICPASSVASSRFCAFSMQEAATAIETVELRPLVEGLRHQVVVAWGRQAAMVKSGDSRRRYRAAADRRRWAQAVCAAP